MRHRGDLVVPAETAVEIVVLKGVAAHWVMRAQDRLDLMERQRTLLAELFEALQQRGSDALAPALRADFAEAADDAARTRVLIDQVASLTDASAVAWHAHLVLGDATGARAAAARQDGSMSTPLVWLPFEPSDIEGLPGSLRYEHADPRADWEADGVPASIEEVAFHVMHYRFSAVDGEHLALMKRLEVVQTQTAGVEHVRPYLPPGVTLCNGRGIHDTSTAELALTLTLASLRELPGVRARPAGARVGLPHQRVPGRQDRPDRRVTARSARPSRPGSAPSRWARSSGSRGARGGSAPSTTSPTCCRSPTW